MVRLNLPEELNQNDSNIETNSYQIEANSLASNSYFISTNTYSDNISMEQLKHYIKYPMVYNQILREISKKAYNENGIYANTIDYMVAIPLLSYITTLRNKTEKLKKQKKSFNLILKLLNHERTTRDILKHGFIDGMYVGILRDTKANNKNINMGISMIDALDRIEGLSLEDNFMIQSLDLDYCKIIGNQNNVSIAAFDMMYFDQFKHGGLINEIKNYPKEFIKAYMNYKKDLSNRWFILNSRTTIALKFRATEDESYGRPLGLSAFTDIKTEDEYKDNQYKLINELASSIYYLILPEGEKKGMCSLNKKQQENVIEAFRNAVRINNSRDETAKISTLSLAPGSKIDRLSKDSSLLKDTLSNELIKKISTNLGFASSALNAEGEGSSSYANLAVNIDLVSSQIFQYINEIAKEYTRIINEYLKIKPSDYIDIKYLPISWTNKDSMYEKAKDLYTLAGGSRRFLIACGGFDADDYLATLDEEIEEGYEDRYFPHQSTFTSNNDTNQSGRPQKDEKDLEPSGQVTRNLKSNEKRKLSTDKN